MTSAAEPSADSIARRHVRAGFVAMAFFVVVGAVLEGLHAFKVPGYVDPEGEVRRLLLRLGHAHGALLAVVNVVHGLVVRAFPEAARAIGSAAHLAALVLLPAGFLLGAWGASGGDPGAAIALAPAGALALVVALVTTARALGRRR